MITLRLFDKEKDYSTVENWWKGHGWDAVPVAILPKLGVIAEDKGKAVAAVWLYMDNSVGVSIMEWFIADPEGSGKSIVYSHRLLCEFLKEEATRMDYGIMLTTCKQASLVKLCEKSGFLKTDEGMTHLMKVLRK